MLTADQVRARRRGNELTLTKLPDKQRPEALAYATHYLDEAQAGIGSTRAELEAQWSSLPVPAKNLKLAAGLRKLVEDLCQFEVKPEVEPQRLREALFTCASALRETGRPFDRDAVVREVAEGLALEPEALEANLYADLKDAHRLLEVNAVSADALLGRYELGQAQAVLLRAVRLSVRVEDTRAEGYRYLFRNIKFRRLLAEVHPEGSGYRIELDGPLSLFTSATKYGLALALVLPAIRAMEAWSLTAEVLWGKKRERLTFKQAGRQAEGMADAPHPEEVEQLLAKWDSLKSAWQVTPKAELLSVPGLGVVVPDLTFQHKDTGEIVYLELLGYWSRDAVWRRLECVQAGLKEKVLFVCSSKLRVSESVFDDTLPSGLLVYKSSLSPKAVREKLDSLEET